MLVEQSCKLGNARIARHVGNYRVVRRVASYINAQQLSQRVTDGKRTPITQYPAQAKEPSGFRSSRLTSTEVKRTNPITFGPELQRTLLRHLQPRRLSPNADGSRRLILLAVAP